MDPAREGIRAFAPEYASPGRKALIEEADRLHRSALRILAYLFLCLIYVLVTARILGTIGLRNPFLPPFLGITFATWTAVRFFDRGRLRDLGLYWGPERLADLALGLLLPLGLMTGILAAEWTAGWLLVAGIRAEVAPLLADFWGFALVAWYEELFARGYLLQTLLRVVPPRAACFLSALVFAGLHAANPEASVPALFGIFLAGVVLGSGCLATGSLYLPMAFHFSWNFFQAFFGFPVSGRVFPGLLQLVREGPPLLTGGRFGPEGGVLGFIALLAAWTAIRFHSGKFSSAAPSGPGPL